MVLNNKGILISYILILRHQFLDEEHSEPIKRYEL